MNQPPAGRRSRKPRSSCLPLLQVAGACRQQRNLAAANLQAACEGASQSIRRPFTRAIFKELFFEERRRPGLEGCDPPTAARVRCTRRRAPRGRVGPKRRRLKSGCCGEAEDDSAPSPRRSEDPSPLALQPADEGVSPRIEHLHYGFWELPTASESWPGLTREPEAEGE
jgi:hypothetical protein